MLPEYCLHKEMLKPESICPPQQQAVLFEILFFFIYKLRAAIGRFQPVLELIRNSKDIALYKKLGCNLLAGETFLPQSAV